MFERKKQIAVFAALLGLVISAFGLDYDSNDFAVEVVEYIEGNNLGIDWILQVPLDDANMALGRPTLETTGDGWSIPLDANVPVVPIYQPFRIFEIVSIGNGGYLTVKFAHRVADDENNPYGIDFIVFGDPIQLTSGGEMWDNSNPEDFKVAGNILSEPGTVAVSQNGNDWYYFSSGPYADDFAPTASYEWDEVNDEWAQELDPTKPIDPNLTASDMDGLTVAAMIETYDGSAGGTGFDLRWLDPNDYAALAVDPDSGRKWIQYVRIEDKPGSAATTEIDAVADVSCCGDYKHPYPIGDFNKDCRVDMADFAVFTSHWLECTWQCP